MNNNSPIAAGLGPNCPSFKYKFLLVPCLLTAILSLVGCSAKQSNSDYFLEKQIERQQAQHQLNSEPIVKEERSAAKLEELADRYLAKGELNRAYIHYAKALGVEPNRVSVLHKQGGLLLKNRKFIAAERLYQQLLSLNDRDSQALTAYGKIYFGLGKFEQAEERFYAALASNPDIWQAHHFLGLIASGRQQYALAAESFSKALTYQPTDINIINNLAVTHYINGNFRQAVRLFEKLAQKSTNPKVHNNLALSYFQLGRYKKAISSFKRGADNEAEAFNNMGCQFLTNKKYSQAIQAFEKAIELYPRYYPTAQKNLASARHQLSHSGKALKN